MTEPLLATSNGDAPGPRRSRIAPFVALAVALVAAGLFVVLAGADPAQNETASTRLLNGPAPEATATHADGSTFDLARRKGSWVVLNFFQSTCAPCKREHPELVDFVEQQGMLGREGAEFYSVVVDDDVESVEAFFAERGGSWPVVYDDDGRFAVAFGVAKVPETWVVDPEGIVRLRVISEVSSEFLATTLQQLREARAAT